MISKSMLIGNVTMTSFDLLTEPSINTDIDLGHLITLIFSHFAQQVYRYLQIRQSTLFWWWLEMRPFNPTLFCYTNFAL